MAGHDSLTAFGCMAGHDPHAEGFEALNHVGFRVAELEFCIKRILRFFK